MFLVLSRLLIVASWSPAGKGLTSWPIVGDVYCIFATFTCGIVGLMWYLIIAFPDLYRLSFFQ